MANIPISDVKSTPFCTKKKHRNSASRNYGAETRISFTSSVQPEPASQMTINNTPDNAREAPESLDVLWRDEHLIAVHKPAGLLVHKSPIDQHETRYAMRILRDQIGQWVYPVHRLDKPTSGLLLFALSSDIARLVSDQFEHRGVKKTYQAVVRGYTPETAEIDHDLKEIAAFKSEKKTVEKMEPKPARTDYQRLTTYELPFSDGRFPTSRYSHLKLYPHTGRKHQIRRHLKHISHPIIGDVSYGKGPHNRLFRDEFGSGRLLLAATRLILEHPLSGEKLDIHCPLAEEFNQLLNQLNQYRTRL